MKTYEVKHCHINSHYGNFILYCFNYGKHEDENVLVFKKDSQNERPLVRIQSACFTAEIFRSKDCDCHEQLETSLNLINNNGGYFIYLLQDGRGAGIFEKVKGLYLTETQGLDTAEAYDKLGIPRDPRKYDKALDVLKYFNINKIRLLTNNPRKITGLANAAIDVIREPIEIKATESSYEYLKTKAIKLGHLMHQFGDNPKHDQ